MATEKIANYTEAQTAELIATYTAVPTKATVEALAVKMGKSAKSIVAKLAKEKVYISATATGAKHRVTKADMAGDIAKLTGMLAADADSLEKASVGALQDLLKQLMDLTEQVVAYRIAQAKAE